MGTSPWIALLLFVAHLVILGVGVALVFLPVAVLAHQLLVPLLLEQLLLCKLVLAHFLQLLLHFESVLGRSNDASLGHLLAIFMIEDHPHRVLEVLKFLRINVLDLAVSNFGLFDQREEDVSREALDFEIELFGDLALLETLVDASDVLAKGRIVIVLDAIVRSDTKEV